MPVTLMMQVLMFVDLILQKLSISLKLTSRKYLPGLSETESKTNSGKSLFFVSPKK